VVLIEDAPLLTTDTKCLSNAKAQVILAIISSQNILDPEEDLLPAEMSYLHYGGVQEDSSKMYPVKLNGRYIYYKE